MKQCLMFMVAFYVSCDVYSSERFRVTVTDCEGLPVTNALVSLGFSAGNVVFAEGKSYNYEARTDTQGKAEIKFVIEIEGQRKPALEGIAAFLYYFN